MNRDDLQLFMTIFEEKNLLKAAGLLYLSPSTAGSRLRAMEEELGFELFERKKGVKAAVPTPKGTEFSRIAAQMLSLWNEADQLSRADDSPPLVRGYGRQLSGLQSDASVPGPGLTPWLFPGYQMLSSGYDLRSGGQKTGGPWLRPLPHQRSPRKCAAGDGGRHGAGGA